MHLNVYSLFAYWICIYIYIYIYYWRCGMEFSFWRFSTFYGVITQFSFSFIFLLIDASSHSCVLVLRVFYRLRKMCLLFSSLEKEWRTKFWKYVMLLEQIVTRLWMTLVNNIRWSQRYAFFFFCQIIILF